MHKNKKTVLITGGGSGIGFVLEKKFIEHGNNIIITGRLLSRLNQAKEKLQDVHIYIKAM